MATKATTITVTRAVLNHLKRFCAARGLKTGAVAEYAINYYIRCCEQPQQHTTATESTNTVITVPAWIVQPPHPPPRKQKEQR